MKIIQGFVGIPSLVNNGVNQVAEFGELSQHSTTFSKDLRTFSDKNAFPHIEVHTLTAIDERSRNIDIPNDIVRHMLSIANWIYTQYNNGSIPMQRQKDSLEKAILNEFNVTKRVQVNEILPTALPSRRLPDNIAFDIETTKDHYRVTLWFSDAKFRVQYKYHHIHVIPPVDDINRLIGNTADVAVSLGAVKVQSVTTRINQYNLANKLTSIQTVSLTWNDVERPGSRLNTEWTLLIHGTAGADTDAMKAAIREYIESQVNYDKWMDVFPDLYSANEFIVVPFWDKLASQDATHDDGQYSTMVTMSDIQLAKIKFIPNSYRYGNNPELFLNTHITLGSVFYRSMMFMAIGNPANKDEAFNFAKIFKDYQAVSTDSVDFVRMSVDTQNFVLKLNECFNHARTYNPSKGLPTGYTLATKGSREYIGFDFEGFTYYVLTRHGYMREV